GTEVTVTVAATYNLGATAYAVSIGILDMPSVPHGWAKGTATSSENTCHENRINAGLAYCAYIPTSASGSDVVTFNLKLNSSMPMYSLRAAVELYSSNGQTISNASTYQDFSVAIPNVSTATTSTPKITTPTFGNTQLDTTTISAIVVALVIIASAG